MLSLRLRTRIHIRRRDGSRRCVKRQRSKSLWTGSNDAYVYADEQHNGDYYNYNCNVRRWRNIKIWWHTRRSEATHCRAFQSFLHKLIFGFVLVAFSCLFGSVVHSFAALWHPSAPFWVYCCPLSAFGCFGNVQKTRGRRFGMFMI